VNFKWLSAQQDIGEGTERLGETRDWRKHEETGETRDWKQTETGRKVQAAWTYSQALVAHCTSGGNHGGVLEDPESSHRG
jgi:hypothetical protein